MGRELSVREVEAAAQRLVGRVHRTPLLRFSSAAAGYGAPVWLKCENLQKTGAFKARGALHYLLCLEDRERYRGVATFSSGNHAGAVAWAGRELNLSVKVFVPEDIPASKAAAIRAYGAELVIAGTTSRHRREAAEAAAAREQLHIVPPFDHPWIIAGQGTAGLEIAEQCEAPGRVLVPVGGGGLLSGVALAVTSRFPEAEVIGVEPEQAAAMAAALERGRPVEIEVGTTVADGLKPVQVGGWCHEIAAARVRRMLQVKDEWIAPAMQLLLERGKLVVEPSGAVGLAACLFHPELRGRGAEGGPTVVVLSGGNADLGRIHSLLESGGGAARG